MLASVWHSRQRPCPFECGGLSVPGWLAPLCTESLHGTLFTCTVRVGRWGRLDAAGRGGVAASH